MKAATVRAISPCHWRIRGAGQYASRRLSCWQSSEARASCSRIPPAVAYWGVAMDLLGNTLAVTPTRADAQAAWDALEKARAIGAKSQRELDWIEALSAYY